MIVKKRKDKFIEFSLYSFSFLSLIIGIGLVFFGCLFITILKYAISFDGYLINLFTIVVLFIGCFLVIFSLLGLTALISNDVIAIAVFTVGLILCSILLLSVGIWSITVNNSRDFVNKMQTEIITSMSLFNETDDKSLDTQKINLLQKKFKCCGLFTYLEWKSNMVLNKNAVLRKKHFLLNPDQIPFDLPDSCCIESTVQNCGKGYVSNKTVYTNGCFSLIHDYLHARIQVISIITFGFASITIITIIYLIYIGVFTKGHYHTLEEKDRNKENK